MRKVVIAVSAVALLSVGLTAASMQAQRAQDASIALAPVVSHAPAAPAAQQTAAAAPAAKNDAVSGANQLVQDFCVGCHDDAQKTGDVTLEHFDAKTVDPVIAGKMLRKLRSGQMPPPGMPRPDDSTVKAFEDMLQSRATGLAMAGGAAAKLAASHGPMVAKVVSFAHTGDEMTTDAQNAMVHQICTHCHNDKMKTGGLTLDHFDAAQVSHNGEVAEMMIRKLRAGMMPPAAAPERPDAASIHAFVVSLEGSDRPRGRGEDPNPGWRPFQRMNRAEYAQAVHDLLDLDVDVDRLPAARHDQRQLRQRRRRAGLLGDAAWTATCGRPSDISRLAVGDLARVGDVRRPTSWAGRSRRWTHVDGAPIGTRGGLSVVHVFPADGDYVFKVELHYEPLGQHLRRHPDDHDGAERADRGLARRSPHRRCSNSNPQMSETDLKNGLIVCDAADPREGRPAPGVGRVRAADAMARSTTCSSRSGTRSPTCSSTLRRDDAAAPPRLHGRRADQGHRRVGHAEPAPHLRLPADASGRRGCRAPTKIVDRLATQAYRGPVAPEDLKSLMGFYDQGRKSGDFENGIRLAVQAILANPHFLFRFEDRPTTVRAGPAVQAGRLELASRLSFFLWGSVPDAQLLKVARRASWRTPAVLDRQVHRMLKDPKSEALATRFAAQWLRLQDLDKIHPDYLLYPMYDDTLGARDEARDGAVLRQHRARATAACSTC